MIRSSYKLDLVIVIMYENFLAFGYWCPCYYVLASILILYGIDVDSKAMLQENRVGSKVLRWCSSSTKSNGSNFNSIHFNRNIKLDMQYLRKRT